MSASKTTDNAASHDDRLVVLTTLLLLGQEARHKKGISDLSFFMVNETYRLFPYRQCLFWETNALGKVKIKTVSGLSVIDSDSPYLVWLEEIISEEIKKDVPFKIYTPQDFDKKDQEDLSEWGVKNPALLCMETTQNGYQCGLWLDRETPFKEKEQHLLSQIGDCYAHAMDRLLRRHKGWKSQILSVISLSRAQKILALFMLIVFLFPVRFSVVSPAEVIARDPFIISSPVQGVIADVEIHPNDEVKKGDALIRMEDTVLRNKVTLASKALDIAQTAYKKASREAFVDSKSKAELGILRSEVESKQLEYDYAVEILSLLSITAPRAGVAVFSDPNALRGVPVRPGERIMSLVDPLDVALLIRIPAESIILVRRDISAKLFLNISPLKSLKAQVKTISYEATADSDGLLTYKVHAVFDKKNASLSIGLKGTARVYGDWTIFGYQMLRRPLVTLRRMTGF